MEEIWKDIPSYEGIYQVSNLGRVKSLSRETKRKGLFMSKEKILKNNISSSGYLKVSLCKNSKVLNANIHTLVAMAFLRHKPDGTHKLVVDHIDNDKNNNTLDNLQIVTQRLNSSKDRKGSSKYTGVQWNKRRKKWISQIRINGKNIFLGHFDSEKDAGNEYEKYLKLFFL